ncbi:MAG TPA: helix-turn-helix transcriptional regulator [Acidimicrobiales bacterium]|jgi:transcriptional regulator with XRE-family HTH domain
MAPIKKESAPSPLRKKLGIELRRLRQGAKISADDAAKRLELSASTISRGETGIVTIHPRDVDAMLRLYGVTDDRKREALLALARKSRERGWWHHYRNVLSSDLVNYISVEYGASTISSFQTMLLPGLLQTADYTRAVATYLPRRTKPAVIEQLVEIRLRRQEMLLHREDPVPTRVVLDQSVLHRPIGGPKIMKAQLEKLVEVGMYPNVEVQIMPYAVGMHSGMGGPFTLFGFAEPIDLAIVHVENHVNFLLVEDEGDIRHYELVFQRVQESALPVADSLALVQEIAEGL